MKNHKRILSLLMCALFLLPLVACGNGDASGALPEGYEKSDGETNYVCIQMNTGKNIVVELYPDVAPKTVANFKKLVSEKFYDGLIFHRVVRGFMIQGGCPEGTGFGDPGWSIEGEFTSNGFENNLKHTRGVLSMARSNDPDSAGSQFFIMHKAASHLDGSYAAFGKVISGMDVVDEIANCMVAGETPVEKQIMEKVFFVKADGDATANAEKDDNSKQPDTEPELTLTPEVVTDTETPEGATNLVCIQMNTGEKIILELYPDVAPIAVANFQKLVSQKYYDGLIFHRVMEGFMIQGGCPEGTGFGGPGWNIKGEFSANGVKNDLKHTRGVLSMARSSNGYDTAGSQFFIMHADAPHLDGNYAAFGKVVEGMDVVDKIATCNVAGETPVVKQVMEKVYFVDESALSATEQAQ